MGARTKLNIAAVNGTVLVAAIFGLLFDSWTVFWLATGLFLAADLYVGAIRISKGKRR